MRMRSRVLSLIAAIVLAAPALASAQTVDELVEKNLAAKGGAEKLKSVKAMRITGRVSVAGMDIPLTITSERPNKLRQESVIQGQKTVTAFDGQKAWTVNPMMGITEPQDITGPQFDLLKDQADLDGPLMDYKAKGITIEIVGKETVEGKPAVRLKVTRKSGQSQTLYLDASTGLELKAINDTKISAPNQPEPVAMTVESVFSDYKPVDGLVLAHTITQTITGPATQTLIITVEKAEMLPDADDALFVKP
jgi:outer membrane lipoprotein-sorting protein